MTRPQIRRAAEMPLASLAIAVEFLTVLNLRRPRPLAMTAAGFSPAFFPLVGLLLGLALVAVDRIASFLLPAPAANALLVVFLAAITGALHLDGMADTADGVFGGRTRERRLEIMRDSRVGSFGAVALTLTVLMQWAALDSLTAPWRTPALLLFPVLGRAGIVAALAAFPYARSEGLGVAFRRHVVPWPLAVAQLSALALAVVCFGAGGAAVWGAAILAALGLGAALTSRLGGLTGDTYGAICEVTEVLVLLLVVSAHRTVWLLPWLIRG